MVESGQLRSNGGGSGKEELRSWMAVKRRERLAKFVAERDRLREREKRPFQPPTKVGPSSTHKLWSSIVTNLDYPNPFGQLQKSKGSYKQNKQKKKILITEILPLATPNHTD